MAEIKLNGPMIMGMNLYEDYLYYSSGIYKHVSGDLLGGHTVKVIGWDFDSDNKLYWII